MKLLEKPIANHKICCIMGDRGDFLVSLNDIVLLEADSNYTLIHLKNGKKLMTSSTMKVFEGLLQTKGFYRVHHSYMINVSCVGDYVKKDGFILLNNGVQIEVARRRKIAFERNVWRKAA